jgi:hypothetical protein
VSITPGKHCFSTESFNALGKDLTHTEALFPGDEVHHPEQETARNRAYTERFVRFYEINFNDSFILDRRAGCGDGDDYRRL